LLPVVSSSSMRQTGQSSRSSVPMECPCSTRYSSQRDRNPFMRRRCWNTVWAGGNGPSTCHRCRPG